MQSNPYDSDTRLGRYKPYTLRNFRQIKHIKRLSSETQFAIEVVGSVLPFRTNNYVVDELIDWNRVPDDPIFVLTFPQRDMLRPHHFARIAALLRRGASPEKVQKAVYQIRSELNPHPAGQVEENVPQFDGVTLPGIQHKYRETVLFFPSQGQTCHAYCTFCFRWPQFVGNNEWKFAMRETDTLLRYLKRHTEVTDVLFTGGDPLVMRTRTLAAYLRPLIDDHPSGLRTIRIGTKALAYWPYRFTTDADAEDLLELFRDIVRKGLHLAIMAHFSHPRELKTQAVRKAIRRIRQTGAVVRTQSPILAHINDHPKLWAEMWRDQVRLGCIPYYAFVVRDTGAQHYFAVPLGKAWEIFQEAYQAVSGIARTVRGPSMSAAPGKVQVIGVERVGGEKVFVLQFLQGRDPDWVLRPFFARYDPHAIWLDDLRPAMGASRFFFQRPKTLFH